MSEPQAFRPARDLPEDATRGDPAPAGDATEGTAAPPPGRPSPPSPPPTASAPPVPASRIGKYDLLEELGRGGMGIVYRAYDAELRREVALKTVTAGALLAGDAAERLVREARTAGSLHHPGIVPIHEVGAADGVPYFAMAFVRGRTLEATLRTGGLPGLRERARVVRDAARAVAHAHEHKVVHRDLKPSNLILDDALQVHVLDFGVARCLDDTAGLTATGQMLGTPRYMPVEQIEGDLPRIGPPTDVYALGAVLYQALAGHPPFDGSTTIEIIGKALTCEPKPLRLCDRRIPADLETICLKALEKEPARRYAHAGELADELDRYLNGEAILARPATWAVRVLRRAARHKVIAALAAAVLLAGSWAAAAGWEQAALRARVRANLRQESAIYLDALLSLRREGMSTRKLETKYLPKVQALVAEAERLDPRLPEPSYHLGRLHRATLHFAAAMEAQNAALAKDPAYAPSRYERALLAARLRAERLEFLREQALRESGFLLAPPTGQSGAPVTPSPVPSPDLEARARDDAQARELLARILADLAALEEAGAAGDPATGRAPGRLRCAQGLALAYGSSRPEDRDRARTLLTQALRDDPALEEASEGLAYVDLADGRWEEAVAVYDRGLESDQGYLPFRLGRGAICRDQALQGFFLGDDPIALLDRAEGDFTAAVALDPESAEACRGLGTTAAYRAYILAARGQDPLPLYRRAIADLDRSLQLDPGSAAAWTGRALVRLVWAAAVIPRGDDPQELFGQADADFARALELEPGSCEAWVHRGALRSSWAGFLARRGGDPAPRFRGADADLTRALALGPKRVEAWIWRGRLRLQRGLAGEATDGGEVALYRAAQEDFAQAAALAPGDSRAWLGRGMAELHLARLAEAADPGPSEHHRAAVTHMEQAARLNPRVPDGWHWLGAALRRLGEATDEVGGDPSADFARAAEALDRALAVHPTHHGARVEQALLVLAGLPRRIRRGEAPGPILERALADVAGVLETNPAYAPAWLARGNLLGETARITAAAGTDASAQWQEAAAAYDRAVALQAHNAEALWRRGLVRCARAQWSQALADFDAALRIEPGCERRFATRRAEARERARAEGGANTEEKTR